MDGNGHGNIMITIVQGSVLSTLHLLIPLNFPINPMMVFALYFYLYYYFAIRKQRYREIDNKPRVTELANNRGRMQTQAVHCQRAWPSSTRYVLS